MRLATANGGMHPHGLGLRCAGMVAYYYLFEYLAREFVYDK